MKILDVLQSLYKYGIFTMAKEGSVFTIIYKRTNDPYGRLTYHKYYQFRLNDVTIYKTRFRKELINEIDIYINKGFVKI
jgi:hypothetical protein